MGLFRDKGRQEAILESFSWKVMMFTRTYGKNKSD